MPSGILASLAVEIGAEISGFQRGVATAKKELAGLVKAGQAMQSIGQSLSLYVSAPLAAVATLAVGASGKIESLRNGLQAITTQELAKQGTVGLEAIQQAAVNTTARLKELEKLAQLPGLGFEEAVKGDVRLRAVGISSEQSAKSIKAFANAIATTGGGKNEFDRVTVQLAQLSAKGKVLAQDLRPIIEAAPAVSGALQKLYGTVDSETISASLAKQGQSSTDFIRVLTDELGKLPQVTGGLKNSLENFADTATLSLAKIGDGISKSLNLPAVLASLSNGVTRVGDAFANLSPGAQTAIVALAGLVAATGPVLVAVGTLGASLPFVVAGFETLGLSSLAALGPILPVAAAVALAAYVIVDSWGELTAYFTTGAGGRVFGDLADSIGNSVAEIRTALASLTGNNFGDLVSALGLLKALVKDVAVGFTALSDVVGGTIGTITRLLKGDFAGSLEQAKRALFGLIDPLANVLGFTRRIDLQGTFAGAFDAIEQVSGLVGGDLATGLGRSTGLLAELEAKLKALKDAKPDLTSEADIRATNQQIAALEAQIKRLNELGIASKGAQTALAKLREELLANQQQSTLLGTQYDYLGERQKILEKGVRDLLVKGYSPASAVVRGFAAELRQLNTDLGDNARLTTSAIDGLAKLKVVPDSKKPVNPLDGTEIKTYTVPTRLNILPVDQGELDSSLDAAVAYVGDTYTRLNEAQRTALQNATEFNTGMESILVGGLTDVASGIGEAIGQMVSNAGGIELVGAALLGGVGTMAVQLGELAVGIGIATLGIKAALESLNPVAAIAGGIALIALGTLAKGAASRISSGGSSAVPSGGSYSPLKTAAAAVPEQRIKIELEPVTFRQKGPDLEGVVGVNKYRRLRLS